MPIEITGLVHHNRSAPLAPRPLAEFDPAFIADSARAQEIAGYDRVLIANAAIMPDSHTIAAHVAANTKTMRMMIAHRPGFIAPTMAARMLATVDQLSGGRASVHIIAGPSDKELEADGDFMTKDLRYARAREYVAIMRRLWSSDEPFDHDGEFYRFNQAFMAVKPLQRPAIPVFWGGTSEASVDACGASADIYALSGDTLANIGEMVGRGRTAASAYGRTLEFMMTIVVILGQTEEEAWDKADQTLDEFLTLKGLGQAPGQTEKGRSNFDVRSDASARQLRSADAGLRQDRCLWLGMTQAAGGKFGNQTTLVGTPEQVTEALMDYYRLGVTRFLIRGYRPGTDIALFGAELFPRLRAAAADHDVRPAG